MTRAGEVEEIVSKTKLLLATNSILIRDSIHTTALIEEENRITNKYLALLYQNLNDMDKAIG